MLPRQQMVLVAFADRAAADPNAGRRHGDHRRQQLRRQARASRAAVSWLVTRQSEVGDHFPVLVQPFFDETGSAIELACRFIPRFVADRNVADVAEPHDFIQHFTQRGLAVASALMGAIDHEAVDARLIVICGASYIRKPTTRSPAMTTRGRASRSVSASSSDSALLATKSIWSGASSRAATRARLAPVTETRRMSAARQADALAPSSVTGSTNRCSLAGLPRQTELGSSTSPFITKLSSIGHRAVAHRHAVVDEGGRAEGAAIADADEVRLERAFLQRMRLDHAAFVERGVVADLDQRAFGESRRRHRRGCRPCAPSMRSIIGRNGVPANMPTIGESDSFQCRSWRQKGGS